MPQVFFFSSGEVLKKDPTERKIISPFFFQQLSKKFNLAFIIFFYLNEIQLLYAMMQTLCQNRYLRLLHINIFYSKLFFVRFY